jgi:hypothetical protein
MSRAVFVHPKKDRRSDGPFHGIAVAGIPDIGNEAQNPLLKLLGVMAIGIGQIGSPK